MTKPLPPDQKQAQLSKLKGHESIWSRKIFPSTTRRYRITPKKLKSALQRYSRETTSLAKILKSINMRIQTLWELIEIYPEIRAAYEIARQRKAKAYGDAASDLYLDKIPHQFVETVRGETKLSQAGMTYLRDKGHMLLRQAQIHETGSYVERHQIDQRSVGVTAHVQLSMEDLEGMTLEDLVRLQGETRRRP